MTTCTTSFLGPLREWEWALVLVLAVAVALVALVANRRTINLEKKNPRRGAP